MEISTDSRASFPAAPARYRIDAFCDRGGVGSVYRVWDNDLGRWVALKFLRDDRPEHRARMLREARAQARVDHPNVCRIFDAGISGERLYIAMQWIDGQRLDVAAAGLTVEQKIGVIRDVAAAVHAAHTKGVIHRDLKPANILVEERLDGGLHPYVVDFGLARAVDDIRETATGEIVGTPQYLSPEQAWGLPADRRSDVYSLGATLYELLTGVPPFSGHSPTDVVMQVISRGVRPLRQVNRSVPRDLAVIVETCLSKEPERRYESARALADDLDRWLRNDPIAARPPGIVYRTVALLRRHRRMAVGIVAATVMTAAVATARIVTLQRAQAEREAIVRLEQRVRYVERLIEYDRSLPLHDTRPAVARATREIATFPADDAARFPRPLAYADGRARLKAGDVVAARQSLERAWNSGLRTPAVGYHLGIALSDEYARALAGAERIPQSELRQQRMRELRQRFQSAASPPLSVARGYAEQPAALIEARLAFVDGDDRRTVELTNRVMERFPWNNDARLLQAEARMRIGRGHRLAGRFREARAAYERVRAAYEAARITAPSDIRVLDGLCQNAASLLQLASDAGEDEEASFNRAKTACEAALIADPERVTALVALSSAWTQIAFYRGKRGPDDVPARAKAIEIIERALELTPNDVAVLVQAGAAYYWMPLEYAPRVATFMRRAVALDPHAAHTRHSLGRALLRLSDYLAARGKDRRAVANEAIREYREVLRLIPDYVPALNNLAYAYYHLGDYDSRTGGDPEPHFRAIVDLLEPKLTSHPQVASFRHIMAVAYFALARHRSDEGDDASHELEKAERLHLESRRLNPASPNSYVGLFQVHLQQVFVARDEDSRVRALRAADEDLEEIRARGIEESAAFAIFDWYLAHAAAERRPDAALRHLDDAVTYLNRLERLPDHRSMILLSRGRGARLRCRVAPQYCDPGAAERYFMQVAARNPLMLIDVERARRE